MKKITFLLLHLGYGGIETATINTCNNLCDEYDVEIVSFYKLKDSQTSSLDPRVKIKFLYDGGPNREEFLIAKQKHNIFKMIYEGVKALKILYLRKHLIIKEIKESTSDYIVSTRIDYSILLNKYGKSIKIVQEHRHHNWEKNYVKKLQSLKNIDYIFALTDSLKRDYERFLRKTNVKIVVVPNMISMPKDKSSLRSGDLITICRLHSIKKIDEMISIFSKLENDKTKLYIVGSGDEEERLKVMTENMGLTDRVIFTGYLTKKEMIPYLKKSSVFLMTSITEGLPMVLLEAMSYGIPCIAYRTESGVSDIIDNGINGYIIDNRNEAIYVDTLNRMLKDKKELKRLGVGAKEKAYKFSREEVKKIWVDILK